MISHLRMALLGYRYDYSRSTDEKIVNEIHYSLRDKLDDVDDEIRRLSRTIAQYRAQLAMRHIASKLAFELASVFILPFFIPFCWLAFQLQEHSKTKRPCDGVKLVFAERFRRNPEIYVVPEDLKELTTVTQPLVHHRLSSSDAQIIGRLLLTAMCLRTPYPIQLALKCAFDIAAVRAAIMGHAPAFILVYWEFSCSLSFVTHAMAQQGVETYNVMHGDKHYYAKHAFFEVNRCYCWSSFYINIFKAEHARADFRLFTNPGFVISEDEKAYLLNNTASGIGIAAPHMATLVRHEDLGHEAGLAFAETVNALAATRPITIRPHPFYESDFVAIEPYLSDDVLVEPPSSKAARMFLLDHRFIVGTVSTLLLEAAHLDRQVVIISTPVTQDVESYHYLYSMPNVTLCTLDTLQETIENIDGGATLGQTGIASEQKPDMS